MSSPYRRWTIALVAVLVLLALAAAAARIALDRLAPRVAQALGPQASIASIELGLTGVQVRGLVVRGARGRWPAEHELRADRVTIRPSLSSLWRGTVAISHITVEGGYLALLRTRDGKLQVLPSLIDRPRRDAPARDDDAAPALHIGEITLREVTVDLFDATVTAGAPHRIRFARLRADVGPLDLPALDQRIAIDLDAAVQGVRREGRLSLAGHFMPSTREADLTLEARDVDLIALQPYLLKSGESSVKSGALDLRLHAKAARQRLHAPGRIVLRGLQLQSGGSVLATFGGVPKQAVLAALARDGRIELDFALEGRVDDPKFSLNEQFAARFTVGLAQKLGVGIGGVVEGVGQALKGLLGR